jgi:enoyl-CoA hydratase/carnithine racemase
MVGGLRMSEVLLDVADGIATITLNRPGALNAFNDAMEAGLLSALERCDRDDAVRVVILTGAGRAFCAGMDLTDATFEAWRRSPTAPAGTHFDVGEELPLRRDGGGRVVLRLFELTKPVIAAINGHAVGVGITMTLPADIRIVAENANIGFVFTRRGLVPESCSSWFLPRVVPMQTALEWMLTGRVFTAAQALERGLARSLHPADQVLNVARGLARDIADHTAPVSVALARRMLWGLSGVEHPMSAHQSETLALNARGLRADAAEGIAAFFEKRRPNFPDRLSDGLPDVLGGLPSPTYLPSPGGAA